MIEVLMINSTATSLLSRFTKLISHMFETVAPMRMAMARPSPLAQGGLLVFRYTSPHPPVANTVNLAEMRRTFPEALCSTIAP